MAWSIAMLPRRAFGFSGTLLVVTSAGCASQSQLQSNAGLTESAFVQAKPGVQFTGDVGSMRAYLDREYLPYVEPSVGDFSGYAGHIINYIGEKRGPRCADYLSARKEVTLTNVILDDTTAIDGDPAGKLVEVFLSSERGAEAGILTFFKGAVSNTSSLQILVQDVAYQTAIPVIDQSKVATVKATEPPDNVCDRRVIAVAALTETISKRYVEVGREANAAGFNIKIGGKWHNSTSQFFRELFVHVETRPL